jgi:hypothetical protein
MEIAGNVKSNFQRTTVPCFDEMKVSGTYEYDQKDDEIMGPHAYMKVVLARSLFDSWKKPVYIHEKMTEVILKSIISKLHKINYNVVACASDCGGGNQGLRKELAINIDKTFIIHPQTEGHIYFLLIYHTC